MNSARIQESLDVLVNLAGILTSINCSVEDHVLPALPMYLEFSTTFVEHVMKAGPSTIRHKIPPRMAINFRKPVLRDPEYASQRTVIKAQRLLIQTCVTEQLVGLKSTATVLTPFSPVLNLDRIIGNVVTHACSTLKRLGSSYSMRT